MIRSYHPAHQLCTAPGCPQNHLINCPTVTMVGFFQVIPGASLGQDPQVSSIAGIALLHLDVVHVQNVPYDPLHHP